MAGSKQERERRRRAREYEARKAVHELQVERRGRDNRLALWGVTILGGFVLMRAVGFHGVDRLIALRHTGVSMNYLFENAGLLLIAINAVAILRRGDADAAGLSDPAAGEGTPDHAGLTPPRPATRARR